jgi:protein tyrosine phosphatase (PTP) superfamily phosphohydrolase (DUF442 family)
MERVRRVLPVALMLGFESCATAPPAPATISTLVPQDDFCAGVVNFAKVSDALWRGAQPTAEGFRNLEKAGARTVVNLRHDHDDSELLEGTKLKYVWIKSRAWDPDEEDIVSFLKVLQDPRNWPIYVHCAQGRDRTGYCVASYRIVDQGWDAEDAIREMHDFHYNSIWFRNPDFLRELDVKAVRALVTGDK